jgi:methylase of polypeptide subunit release factors
VEPIAIERTGGLGTLRLYECELTPASRLMLEAVGANRELLRGAGLDWGSGGGCLAIAAARIPAVERVLGLELDPESVRVARENAALNDVAGCVTFLCADLFEPPPGEERAPLDALRGRAAFLIANPPASRGDDGLGWRRRVLAGALDYLAPGAPVLLQISYQYGVARIEGLTRDVAGYAYQGVAAETDWVPFDQERPDLARQLREYGEEEARGGLAYTFEGERTATEALAHFDATGVSPRSKWQAHLYRVSGR